MASSSLKNNSVSTCR